MKLNTDGNADFEVAKLRQKAQELVEACDKYMSTDSEFLKERSAMHVALQFVNVNFLADELGKALGLPMSKAEQQALADEQPRFYLDKDERDFWWVCDTEAPHPHRIDGPWLVAEMAQVECDGRNSEAAK